MMHLLYFFCLISAAVVASDNSGNSSTGRELVTEDEAMLATREGMTALKKIFSKFDQSFVDVVSDIAKIPELERNEFLKKYFELIALICPFRRVMADIERPDETKLLVCATGLREEPKPLCLVAEGLSELHRCLFEFLQSRRQGSKSS